MLVISRKAGESLILSDNIKITILSIGSDKIALGIDAPRSVTVVREELLETIKANRESVDQSGSQNYADIASMLKSNKFVKNIK
ncbi:MAG: carbon storage regulator [Bacillota bacterium]|jgi:carbon storage regulator|nr:carbon storage regulator [Bacillota bacterium]NLM08927.1 carbon storage regulator [Clostridiales Family XIII bacterium]